MADVVTTFMIVAAILFVGFLANLLFKKTGWPEILFLILIGIIIGPVLGLFPKEASLPVLPLISTFTLLMVLLRGGLELNVHEVLSGSAQFNAGLHPQPNRRSCDHTSGKETPTETQSVILLSLESVMTSIFNIVFFYAFLQAQTIGVFDLPKTAIEIGANFLVGIVIGVVMGVAWIRVLFSLGKQELAYMITLSYAFLMYSVSEFLMGSGPLSVLAFGLILGNDKRFLRL